MANYTAADVKRLRELTGAGMMDSKNALVEADADFDKAQVRAAREAAVSKAEGQKRSDERRRLNEVARIHSPL